MTYNQRLFSISSLLQNAVKIIDGYDATGPSDELEAPPKADFTPYRFVKTAPAVGLWYRFHAHNFHRYGNARRLVL